MLQWIIRGKWGTLQKKRGRGRHAGRRAALESEKIDSKWIIADLSCGGGAFFDLHNVFPDNIYIGNDIDEIALKCAQQNFPFVHYIKSNAFTNVCREHYGIKFHDKLIIVGNPPYNDTTSIINNSLKKDNIKIDTDIKTRDLGITALLSYAKLNADYVAVLHPLSYLIKPANFKLGQKFFKNYKIKQHIVFNSQEFANTSKMTGFPVIVALYEKTIFEGLSYENIKNFTFKTVEGFSFSLKDNDYISDFIEKYPHEHRYTPEILFYTQRDINALKRGKTFKLEGKEVARSKKGKVKRFRPIAYESTNKKIATVTSKGIVKGVKKGTATITATTKDGKKTAKCKVTVK